jgi:hypothetical protein
MGVQLRSGLEAAMDRIPAGTPRSPEQSFMAISHHRASLAQQTVCWLVAAVYAAGAAVLRVRHCSLVICSTSISKTVNSN